jgi:hypothetical protein
MSTMKMEAALYSETFVSSHHITRCKSPETLDFNAIYLKCKVIFDLLVYPGHLQSAGKDA